MTIFEADWNTARMGKEDRGILNRRLRSAYMSSVISISLVLLLVGMASLLLVNARSVSDYFKENMKVSVMLDRDVSEKKAMDFQSAVDTMRFIKSTEFISAEQGRKEMEALLGEDFLDVFETSPIPISVDVTLKADYVSADSLETVKSELLAFPEVDEVVYQRSLVDALNANLGRISLVLGVFIALMLFISFVLINNTIRLSVYARRFTIHTMKLVGATRAFIRAPFLLQAAFQGLFSAMIAIVVLIVALFFLRSEFAGLFGIFRLELLLAVMGIVLVSGVLICVVSTCFVVNRLVSLRKDELYY